MEIGIVPVIAITVIVYAIAAGVKATSLDDKWIPVICMILGGILGALGWQIIPDYPAQDIFTAIAVGIASGGAATCVNQIYKQQLK